MAHDDKRNYDDNDSYVELPANTSVLIDIDEDGDIAVID